MRVYVSTAKTPSQNLKLPVLASVSLVSFRPDQVLEVTVSSSIVRLDQDF